MGSNPPLPRVQIVRGGTGEEREEGGVMDKQRLERRVFGRQQADAALGLVELTHSDHIDGFIDQVVTKLRPPVPVDEKKQRIERERAYAEFANHRIQFGEHRGEKLEVIPRDYLEWLRESSAETLRMIEGYLDATEEHNSGQWTDVGIHPGGRD